MTAILAKLTDFPASSAAAHPADGARARGGAGGAQAAARRHARAATIGELAEAAGLTERRLNQGFRILFGATVFETLRNERLELARQALEKGAVSLKDVAYRVGYSHVTNFINVYKAHFGAPPRRHGGRGQSEGPFTPPAAPR